MSFFKRRKEKRYEEAQLQLITLEEDKEEAIERRKQLEITLAGGFIPPGRIHETIERKLQEEELHLQQIDEQIQEIKELLEGYE